MGIKYETASVSADIKINSKETVTFAMRQAAHKARAAADNFCEGAVIAADTVVVDEEGIMGKPTSA